MNYLFNLFHNAFTNASIAFLILGGLMFLLGIVLVGMTVYIRIAGRRVNGRVIGAVQDVWTRKKSRNGKLETKTRKILHAVYEYVRPDGSVHREKSSQGGDAILKYHTGQSVELLVIPSSNYDDVYDANDRTSLVTGIVFLTIGVTIMLFAASLMASLSIGIVSILAFLFGLLYKIFIGRNRERTKTKQNRYSKAFSLSEIKPVEYFKGK